MDAERIKELIRVAEENDLEEVEVSEFSGLWSRIRIRRVTGQVAARPLDPVLDGAAVSTPAKMETPEASEGLLSIESPIVGTFYRAPAPDAEAYVEVDDEVEVGQVVCIVEAMKVMNEVQSTVAGRVVSTPVGNAEPVEYGEALFWVEPQVKETSRRK